MSLVVYTNKLQFGCLQFDFSDVQDSWRSQNQRLRLEATMFQFRNDLKLNAKEISS